MTIVPTTRSRMRVRVLNQNRWTPTESERVINTNAQHDGTAQGASDLATTPPLCQSRAASLAFSSEADRMVDEHIPPPSHPKSVTATAAIIRATKPQSVRERTIGVCVKSVCFGDGKLGATQRSCTVVLSFFVFLRCFSAWVHTQNTEYYILQILIVCALKTDTISNRFSSNLCQWSSTPHNVSELPAIWTQVCANLLILLPPPLTAIIYPKCALLRAISLWSVYGCMEAFLRDIINDPCRD